MNERPRKIQFFSIFFILWIPFILRTVFPAYEIYPSIVMPVGASLVESSNRTFEFKRNSVFAWKDSTLQEVSLKLLFPEVPDHYFYTFYSTDFGTSPYCQSFEIRGIIPMRKSNRFTLEKAELATIFLKERLQSKGYISDKISVQTFHVTFDKESKSIISERLINEKIINL